MTVGSSPRMNVGTVQERIDNARRARSTTLDLSNLDLVDLSEASLRSMGGFRVIDLRANPRLSRQARDAVLHLPTVSLTDPSQHVAVQPPPFPVVDDNCAPDSVEKRIDAATRAGERTLNLTNLDIIDLSPSILNRLSQFSVIDLRGNPHLSAAARDQVLHLPVVSLTDAVAPRGKKAPRPRDEGVAPSENPAPPYDEPPPPYSL